MKFTIIESIELLVLWTLKVHKRDIVTFRLSDINFYVILFIILLLIEHKTSNKQKKIITLPVENYSDIFQYKSCSLASNEIHGH